MEILHFCPSRSFSGLEQYALDVAVSQKKMGREVGFVVCPGTRLEKECRDRNLEVVEFDPYQILWPLHFWPKLFGILRNDRALRVLHLHSTQELIHLSQPFFTLRGSPLRPKVILQSHIWINHRKKDLFHKWLYSLVDEFWCSSEAAKKSLQENLPIPENKFKIIPYGRDVEGLEREFLDRTEARKQLGLSQDAVTMGTVSRLEESKGILEFLEAARELLMAGPQLHLAVIGGPTQDDPKAVEYKQRLDKTLDDFETNSRSRVHFLGPLPQSYKYLKAFDLYVLPSHQETFSLSLLDAQLAGLPVVGSESGGTPDVVKEGKTGWLFKPKDVSHLSQKLQEALSNRSLWNEYGRHASETVRRDYNQKTVFKNILSAYGSGL